MDNNQLRTAYAMFCQDMLAWVQEGMPYENPHCFYKGVGLCANLLDWGGLAHADALSAYQTSLFLEAGLSSVWPFDGTHEAYFASKQGAGLYTNEARLQWLRGHAEL